MPQETGGSDLAGCIGTYCVPYFVLDDVLDRCAVSRRRRVSSRHSGRFNKRARAAPVVCGSVRCRDFYVYFNRDLGARWRRGARATGHSGGYRTENVKPIYGWWRPGLEFVVCAGRVGGVAGHASVSSYVPRDVSTCDMCRASRAVISVHMSYRATCKQRVSRYSAMRARPFLIVIRHSRAVHGNDKSRGTAPGSASIDSGSR